MLNVERPTKYCFLSRFPYFVVFHNVLFGLGASSMTYNASLAAFRVSAIL